VLLVVASDRISAYDHILATPIPDKGKVLTALSAWWFEQLADVVPNHLVSLDVPAQVAGRAMICRRLEMYPVECVARGYLTGSGLVEYRQGRSVCGVALPEGLTEASRLPEPIFTPAAKAELGEHDENVTFERVVQMVGDGAATARDALESKLDSADLTSAALTKLKQEAATAFQGGELSAKQYKDVLDQIAAKTEEIKQKNKAADASAAEAHEKSAQAAEAEKEALDKNSEAKEKNAEATGKAANRGRALYDASKLSAEGIANLDDALNRMNDNVTTGTQGYFDLVVKQARAADEYIKDTEKAVAATDNLTQKISDGTVSMQDIAEATHAASSRIAQLDSTTLNNLHAAIDEARQKLKELEEQARDSADSLEAELAQLRGDDSKTAALEQERKLRELNAKLHEAELRNNAEEIAQYRRALDLQQQIGREKQQQAAAKKAEEQQRQQTSNNNGRSSNGNTGSNGRGYTAAEVADAFDARIAKARREGRDDLARELHDEMKRRT